LRTAKAVFKSGIKSINRAGKSFIPEVLKDILKQEIKLQGGFYEEEVF